MSRAASPGVAIAVLAIVFVACSPAAPRPTPGPSVSPGSVLALPVLNTWNGACAGVGLDKAILTGDPADPRLAWLTTPTGRRDVLFPPGFTATFAPTLVIIDATGDIAAREGDVVDGGCVTGPDAGGPLLILGG